MKEGSDSGTKEQRRIMSGRKYCSVSSIDEELKGVENIFTQM